MSVIRIYVTKRKGYRVEGENLLKSLREDLNLKSLKNITILNRYDVEGLSLDELKPSLNTVFAEPMADELFLDNYPKNLTSHNALVFGVEYQSGQYDQRADSAEQCVQVVTGVAKVKIACAKIYILEGGLTQEEIIKIKKYLINDVDQKETNLEKPTTLEMKWEKPAKVLSIVDFITFDENGLKNLIRTMGLAMSLDDLKFAQNYFKNTEHRNPTETELKLLDTYWSDHCRHTTFNTIIDNMEISFSSYKSLFEEALKIYKNMRSFVYGDKQKDITLMDMATIGAKYFRKKGLLNNLEESEENNACSIEIDVKTDNGLEKWLLQFKNETHNHPTEIEPFGGAATCLGGAIRDPLSGRAFVYHAMRVTGAGDPRTDVSETIPGKLMQRKITREAAAGFSSYGNQIGIATGFVEEYYHEGFLAKRMETGAVIGAAPKKNVLRKRPEAGDVVILLGGGTGRDGIGGATGSSKEHNESSILLCGAEVQKGNAPVEHKIQRLFRNPEVTRMIKKCNDFGAGGVGVAIGELAAGLNVNLDAVPKKYEGLNGTEIAVAESQERMAAVVSPCNVEAFINHCCIENLNAAPVAVVTDDNRLKMVWLGDEIVNISREFLDSAGAPRHAQVKIAGIDKDNYFNKLKFKGNSFEERTKNILSDLNVCSKKGLVERFDSTIGAGSVLTAFGGIYGDTPSEYMAAKIPLLEGDTSTISLMACGYNPNICSWSPYHGALYAVVESVSKIIAAGGRLDDIRLSFQEYFERLENDKEKWGKPCAALLGALKAQYELNIAAIGGKDSMSGTFKDQSTGNFINVPPTLISFAVAPSDIERVITPEFKKAGNIIGLIKTPVDKQSVIDFNIFKENIGLIGELNKSKIIKAIYTVKSGGVIEALSKMAFGNRVGFKLNNTLSLDELTLPLYGSFIVELERETPIKNFVEIGETLNEAVIKFKDEVVSLEKIYNFWTYPLENIFPSKVEGTKEIISLRDYNGKPKIVASLTKVKPTIALLALPGTNCEYDTKRAFELAGSRRVTPFVFRNATTAEAVESCEEFAKIIENSQILAVPGGFSAGDEPEGSGKFFVSVFKHPKVRQAIDNLINKRDGLIIGICNGFQALIKTGLLTHGYICDLTENDATLTFNSIGRHVSQMVRTRVASVNSPWLSLRQVGEVDILPVSHGEGRFVAPQKVIDNLFASGQVMFQYVDLEGRVTMEFPYNPNGSVMGIEGICSPNGRALGKMGHGERVGKGVHLNNAYGNMEQRLFEAGVKYFE